MAFTNIIIELITLANNFGVYRRLNKPCLAALTVGLKELKAVI
jgi:hypothetical protein